MNVFVQKVGTGMFLSGEDLWVEGDHHARDFINTTSALLYCVHNKLRNVEVLLCYEGEQWDKLIPVTETPEA